MYYLIQRYKFESNSQLTHCYSCGVKVVLSDTKIQIWKQFTTLSLGDSALPRLYYLIQRYKFESNSQPPLKHGAPLWCCIIWYKDTNLKAIHNDTSNTHYNATVVLSDTKIQIWKQFTTDFTVASSKMMLYYLIQRYKFESNSQPKSCVNWKSFCCIIWYKDTNLKAIHNHR